MAKMSRIATVVIAVTIASCSAPSTSDESLPSEQSRSDAVATTPPPDPSTPNAVGGVVSADTPINSENYSEVMAARSREYERLEYKPVTLNSFECGDNCYLELTERVEGAAPTKVLCTAGLCGDWQPEGHLPTALRNMAAEAKFGTANQVNGAREVVARDVRAVIDLRTPSADRPTADRLSRSSQAAGASSHARSLPLARGVYVAEGTGCRSPVNAGLRIWNGAGLSGSATRNCRTTIQSREGNMFNVSNSCENTYDGSRTVETQAITVRGPTRFTLVEQSYRMCPAGEVPASLENLARQG